METRNDALLCVPDPADPIRLWIDHPKAAEARVLIDGVEAPIELYALPEEPLGRGLRVEIPKGALELVLEVPEPEGPRVWGLMLGTTREQTDERTAELERASGAYGKAMGSADVGLIERTSARFATILREDGRASIAVYVLCGASFRLRTLRAFDAATRMLVDAQAIGASFPGGRSVVATYRGLLAWSQGALHEAVASLRDGARLSLRLEDPIGLPDSLPIYAETLAELGYYEEARYWARKSLEHLPETSCHQASIMRTAGWINLVLRARDQPHDDPEPLLERAIALSRADEACTYKEGGAHISLALLAFGDGDSTKAERHLDAIDMVTLSVEDRVRATDLRVRLRLELDDVEGAWHAWEELRVAAAVVDDDDARWREQVRRGELLLRSSDHQGALEAFERAERQLDRLVRVQAVVGVGRTATADRYLEGTTALVSLLVEQDQLPRAFCVAREARARRRSAAAGLDVLPPGQRQAMQEKIRQYHEHKRQAEQAEVLIDARPQAQEPTLRHDASQSSREANELVDEIVEALMRATASPRCDRLVPPAPGELLVGLYPREDDWLVFTRDEHETSVQVVPVVIPAELAAGPEALGRLLEPISEALAKASSVRVLADREAQLVDVHLLPWRGRPLLAQVPVTYGVELPALPAPAGLQPPRALLLADPTGTLMSARAEIEEVEDRLTQARWAVDTPVTNDPSATSDVSLAGYSLLHYAAHTAVDEGELRVWAPYPAGEAGGLPHLQIGPKARLEVHDILALRPVPPVAFLAGCKTGLVELDAGSTSLALAFLLADGRQVVASRENVDDTVGLEIAKRFYARIGQGAGVDAAVTMHEVQEELLGERRGEAVPYRVWVR